MNRYWEQRLGAVRVRTPDAAFDLLLNRWLLYQTLASRVLARAGFYQAGERSEFRDQLQDVLAFAARRSRACARPHRGQRGQAVRGRRRAALVASAARSGRADAVLRRFAVAPYVDEPVCRGDRRHIDPARGHSVPACRSAVGGRRRSLRSVRAEFGTPDFVRALPAAPGAWRIRAAAWAAVDGLGDWNDGMNRVGAQGAAKASGSPGSPSRRCSGFTGLAARMEREDLAQRWTRRAEELRQAIEADRLGRAMVCACLRRRWAPLGGGRFRRVSHRFDRPVVGDPCRVSVCRSGRTSPSQRRPGNSSASTTGSFGCSGRHSTQRRATPATSRRIRRGSVRTEDSTRTQQPGWASPTPASATAITHGHLRSPQPHPACRVPGGCRALSRGALCAGG